MEDKFPDKVMIIDDDSSACEIIKMILNVDCGGVSKENVMEDDDLDFLQKKLKKGSAELPDIIISDICLKIEDPDIVIKKNKSPLDYAKLGEVSGIRFLTYLRNNFHRLPVVIMSGYWTDEACLPKLSQHGLCMIGKRHLDDYVMAKRIFWTAQQSIIGVHLHPDLNASCKKKAASAIRDINKKQNHFYFKICETEQDLIKPDFPDIKNAEAPLYPQLFETWNNRISGIMEDKSACKSGAQPVFLNAVLPFGRERTVIIKNRLNSIINYMGDDFFKFFFIRECAKASLRVFFDLDDHYFPGLDSCVFEKSNVPVDLLPKKRRTAAEFLYVCNKCRTKIDNINTYGGWNSGRKKAVNRIAEFALDAFKQIK